jgi:hydrophobic/amphiphilic exporter-1 (mainly G- bacteria), HAE1 family
VSEFSIRKPYVIVTMCLVVALLGVMGVVRMPVDLFPAINLPEVIVATFYSGMPPQEVEMEITSRFERFFTMGSGIDWIESRSLPGVSLIKIHFHPTTNADADVTEISNLAMANLRRLPPGTLPPVVLKFDASSLPVCLVTFKGRNFSEAELRDIAQFSVRDQLAGVPGAVTPPPFGGRYRQIMVYVDPHKLQSYQLGVMDVVKAINGANLILPAGDAKIGNRDYQIYTNSQIPDVHQIDAVPLKTTRDGIVTVGDIGSASDAAQVQTNLVRIDGESSVYVPIMKESGEANTIQVVDGIRQKLPHLVGVPKNLLTDVVFDQSAIIRQSIKTLLHEGIIGLLLTSLLILLFLGSGHSTVAAFLSFPISALATFIALYFGGSSLNVMVLAGLALGFSRLIANAVIVVENIYRHMEMGEPPDRAAAEGAKEVSIPVLTATLSAVVVFLPVIFLHGVSKFLFSALALAVVLSVCFSYFVAMTVVPLYCSRFLKREGSADSLERAFSRLHSFRAQFDRAFDGMLRGYERLSMELLERPRPLLVGLLAFLAIAALLGSFLGVSFFPRTDAGQFVINLKARAGTRLEKTTEEVAKVEDIVRRVIPPRDLSIVVSNIGVTPGFSAIYTSNSAPHTAFVQVALQDGHRTSSFVYMERVRERLAQEMPELTVLFQSGGRVDSVLNSGAPSPIDVEVTGPSLREDFDAAATLAAGIRKLPDVAGVFIPPDVDYPALRLDIDRQRAEQVGLSQRDVVDGVITALTSNGMINPGYWIDPHTGNDYLLTVQYREEYVHGIDDLRGIPLRGSTQNDPVLLDAVSSITHASSPTEVDHHQIQRVVDVYVSPRGEDLSRVSSGIQDILSRVALPADTSVTVGGIVTEMRASFVSFALGLLISVALLYLILTAQFASFREPWLVLLCVPLGLAGALIGLLVSRSTLNIMSLMGVVMLVDLVAANGILILEMALRLRREGEPAGRAAVLACRIRMRPILMTSLATMIGLLPMALRMGTGSEAYAPLAWTIIGGLFFSVALTFLVFPVAFEWMSRHESH